MWAPNLIGLSSLQKVKQTAEASAPHCEDTVRREPFESQGENCYLKLAWWHLDLGLQNCVRISLCCLNFQACGILLGQPEQTDTLATYCV